ncbi:MAG: protease modulator HflC [Spirochaetales bacterium]|nr:protease modulator HflC [Spirochaetales bacterium]
MKSKGAFLIVIIAVIIIGTFYFSVYILEEGQQSIVLRFGEIVDIQTEAGLKFKLPFFFVEADVVKIFPKKLLSWDGNPQVIPTERTEAQFIYVDTTARWYIRDPQKFYESLGNMTEAYKKFDDIIDSAVRMIINGNLLSEIIRDTKTPVEFEMSDFLNLNSLLLKFKNADNAMINYISQYMPVDVMSMIKVFKGDETIISRKIIDSFVMVFNKLLQDNNLYDETRFKGIELIEHAKTLIEQDERTEEEQKTLNRLLLEAAFKQEITMSPVKKGRTALSMEMLNIAREKMFDRDRDTGAVLQNANGKPVNQFGIELRDIVIRQIRYSDDLKESVFQRMIKERNQLAEKKRAEGIALKEQILGQMDKEVKTLISEGKMESEKTKGEADNYVTKVYADAYRQDPSFFRLWRTLESYKKVLPGFKKTLSTDADYFNYLYDSTGR